MRTPFFKVYPLRVLFKDAFIILPICRIFILSNIRSFSLIYCFSIRLIFLYICSWIWELQDEQFKSFLQWDVVKIIEFGGGMEGYGEELNAFVEYVAFTTCVDVCVRVWRFIQNRFDKRVLLISDGLTHSSPYVLLIWQKGYQYHGVRLLFSLMYTYQVSNKTCFCR